MWFQQGVPTSENIVLRYLRPVMEGCSCILVLCCDTTGLQKLTAKGLYGLGLALMQSVVLESSRAMDPRSKLPHQGYYVSVVLRALFMLLICCVEFPHAECVQSFAAAPAPAPAMVNGTRFSKIFVFGDSYVDIGNHDPKNGTRTVIGVVNQPWRVPYGQSDGAPTGRYSSGILLSDYLANYLGLHPRPYLVFQNRSETRTEDGINFAVGGAGEFDNLGFTKIRDQISQLKTVLNSGTYSGTVYNESLILFTISGNDYSNFLRNAGINLLTGIDGFVVSVVNQIIKDVKSLYDLGFRDFAVSYLPPVGCVPSITVFSAYLLCFDLINVIVTTRHNNLLKEMISSNISTLPGANVILLNTELAFKEVFTDLQVRSVFPIPLKPCCKGFGITDGTPNLCGDVDSAGRPLYTVCSVNSTSRYFFWDEGHPTEAGWAYIFNLFMNPVYTNGKSLTQFLQA